jgi:hypothetical protein
MEVDDRSIIMFFKKGLRNIQDLFMPEAKSSKTSIQPEESLSKMIPLSLDEPSMVTHVGNSLDPK